MPLDIAFKIRMKEMNIGNKELSELSGVPLRTVNNIILGITKNPSINVVMDMARALGCTVDEIIRDMDDKSSPYEPHTLAAHASEEEWSPEEQEDIEKFKAYLRSKRNNK